MTSINSMAGLGLMTIQERRESMNFPLERNTVQPIQPINGIREQPEGQQLSGQIASPGAGEEVRPVQGPQEGLYRMGVGGMSVLSGNISGATLNILV